MPILYNMRSAGPNWTITKFDEDFNVEASYTLSPDGEDVACDCPAGVRPTCRHRKMLPAFALAGAIDTDQFYCFETRSWHRPFPRFDPADYPGGKPIDAAEPRDLHNAIAEAVGEPTIPKPTQTPLRRLK